MTKDDPIQTRVRQALIDSLSVNIEESDLDDGDSLEQIIGLDSLAALEFVTALEKEFGIVFQPEELNLKFLGNLAALTERIRARLAVGADSKAPA